MKRLSGTLGIGLALVWGLLILVTGTPQVQAQTTPNAPAAPHTVYLPLIANVTGLIKGKSGIHLGNRSSDWQPAFLQHIQPPPKGAADGQWPAAVVIQSNQVYDIFRPAGRGPSSAANNDPDLCWVNGAAVKKNNGQEYAVYDYLTRAIQNGTLVVIRITPSPGNFLDYDHPGVGQHTLLTTNIAGGDYCGDPETQKHKVEKFRDVYDLAREMDAIYQVNTAHGWPLDRFYFEPANEPNLEWYVYKEHVTPDVTTKDAWMQMDNYFSALYDIVKGTETTPGLNPNIQILTPPMGQDQYAEHYHIRGCNPMWIDKENQTSGLDYMKQTFGVDFESAINIRAPKADGFSWHNYFNLDGEGWQKPFNPDSTVDVIDDYCNHGYEKLDTDHVSQYISAALQWQLRNSRLPTFITEADRKSPCQNGYKGSAGGNLSKLANATQMQDSLNQFIEAEKVAQYVIVWLLTNEYADEDTVCVTPIPGTNGRYNQNYEINWHVAYNERGEEQMWFHLWWPKAK